MKLRDWSEDRNRCEHCDQPECDCSAQVEPEGISRTGDSMTVTAPPQVASKDAAEAVVAKIDDMIRERGGNPDDWEVDRWTVNEWGHGPDPMRQTKASLRLKVSAKDAAWQTLLDELAAIGTAREPRQTRTPAAKTAGFTYVCIGDDQAPHVNWPLHEATCDALAEIRPDGMVYMGDGIDASDLGRWASTKTGTRYDATVNQCLEVLHRVLAERAEAAGLGPGQDMHYLVGNHDERIVKDLRRQLPQMVGVKQAGTDLDVLDVGFLANLAPIGFKVVHDDRGDYPHGTVELAPGLLATHGWKVRKGAGASALASIEHLNASLLTGHTHRLAVSHLTRWNSDQTADVYTVGETGTMAALDGLGYTREPDWQGGFLTVTLSDDGFSVEPAVWRDNALYWRDRRWTA